MKFNEAFRKLERRSVCNREMERKFQYVGRERQGMNEKRYEYESLVYSAGDTGGAYVIFPYDIRKEFGRGRVKVHATFDGEPYEGSIVNMGVRNGDGSICYILGLRKDISAKIGKQPGDKVRVTVAERE